jgi:hypothetical protein
VATLSSLLTPPKSGIEQFQVIHSTYLGESWRLAFLGALLLAPLRSAGVAICAVLLALLALGSSTYVGEDHYTLPMAWIEYLAPIAKQSGSHYRLVSGVTVALAACAAFAVGALAGRSRILAMGAMGWLVWTGLGQTNSLAGHKPPLKVRRAYWNPGTDVLEGGQGPVLDLPLLKAQGCDKNVFRYMNSFALHGRPYLHTMEPPVLYRDSEILVQRLQRALESETCPERTGALLEQLRIGALIVHMDVPCALASESIECLREVLGAPIQDSSTLIWDGLRKN